MTAQSLHDDVAVTDKSTQTLDVEVRNKTVIRRKTVRPLPAARIANVRQEPLVQVDRVGLTLEFLKLRKPKSLALLIRFCRFKELLNGVKQ